MQTKLIIAVLFLSFTQIGLAQNKKAKLTESQKIEALIKSIENLQQARFYRNGSYYDAKTAGQHLRMKLDKAGDRIKTARDFIEKLASKSSMSGEDYKIVYNDGRVILARNYLYAILKTLE